MPYTAVWAWREARQRLQNRHEKRKALKREFWLERFTRSERWMHTILIICFMALSVTGVAWMYIETGLGNTLALPFGGGDGAVWVHRLFGLILMITFAVHIVHLIRSALVARKATSAARTAWSGPGVTSKPYTSICPGCLDAGSTRYLTVGPGGRNSITGQSGGDFLSLDRPVC